MDNFHVYKDIESRTGGEIYLGVAGPVRTGKSTFIKRFMEHMVLPDLPEGNRKDRTRDELPQSAAGRMIMTTEPKFIPKDAAEITLEEGVQVKVRLIDCVGFMVDGALGHMENGEERMVKTPWYDYEIPFTKAAGIGTEKVIREHATIGIVITADGSFGELERDDYRDAERQTIEELKAIGKPFVVLLNSSMPYSEETMEYAGQLEELYQVSVLPVNCEQLKKEDIRRIMDCVLKEFPVCSMNFYIPKWLEILDHTHPLKQKMIQTAEKLLKNTVQMKDIRKNADLCTQEDGAEIRLREADLSNGTVSVDVIMDDDRYYEVLSEQTGMEIPDEYELFRILKKLSLMQSEYEKVGKAMEEVRGSGYGIVMADKNEIQLTEPELIRHGNRYGVKIHAKSPSINLIKAYIETEIAPIVGSEQQAKDLITYIKSCESSEDGVWETNIFGKSVEQIVEDGIRTKISQMTEDCQMKLQDTLQKIINDSNGGMICIII